MDIARETLEDTRTKRDVTQYCMVWRHWQALYFEIFEVLAGLVELDNKGCQPNDNYSYGKRADVV